MCSLTCKSSRLNVQSILSLAILRNSQCRVRIKKKMLNMHHSENVYV